MTNLLVDGIYGLDSPECPDWFLPVFGPRFQFTCSHLPLKKLYVPIQQANPLSITDNCPRFGGISFVSAI